MAHLDNKPDQGVFGDYGLRGFPTMLILDHDGEVLYGKDTPFRASNRPALHRALNTVSALFVARRAAAAPDATALDKARLVLLEGLRKPATADFDAMEKASKVEGMDPKLCAEFNEMRKRGPFLIIFRAYKAKYDGAKNDVTAKIKARQEALAQTYRIYKKGHTIDNPSDDLHRPFWILAFDGAAAEKDHEHAERAYNVFKQVYQDDVKYRSHVTKMKKKLETMRE